MSVFDEIVEKVARSDTPRTAGITRSLAPLDLSGDSNFGAQTDGDPELDFSLRLNPSSIDRDFIEWSTQHPKKKTDDYNQGSKQNYWFEGNSLLKTVDPHGMNRTNISWMELNLITLGPERFSGFFRKAYWTAIRNAAAKQLVQPVLSQQDLFYFFASTFQRVLDPKHKVFNDLGGMTSGEKSNFKFEPFRKMVPYVFKKYIDTSIKNGTYSKLFNLGPDKVTVDGFSIHSSWQWSSSLTINSWHTLFDDPAFSGDRTDGVDGLLTDNLISLENIQKLFTLEMILNLKEDIETNTELYKEHEERALSQEFSIAEQVRLGPGGNGLNFDQALNFWNLFIDKYLAAHPDAPLSEELEKENKLFIFDPDSCAIPAPTDTEEPCPPPCVPNPSAATVDWTKAPTEQPFLNERTCEYWTPITTKYENLLAVPATAIVNEQIEPGIKLILEFVGKEVTEDIVLSLVSQITTDYFVDFRSGAKIKVLIKLPFDAVFALEDKEQKSEDETSNSSDFPLNVVLTSRDIRGKGSFLGIVSRAIGNKYSVQYEIMRYRGELSGLPQDIMLKKEGDRIIQFKKALIDLLRDQNFKFNPTRKKSGMLEAIEIGFKEDFTGIEYIKANNVGCAEVELGTNKEGVIDGGAGWKSFLNKSVVEYPTTLAFMANIPSIYENVTADSPMVVDLFLKTYYFPRIEEVVGQDLTMAQEFIAENDCNTAELVAGLVRPSLILGSEVAGTALTFPELLFKSTLQRTCQTTAQKEEQDKKYNAFTDIEERWEDARLRKDKTEDEDPEDLSRQLDEATTLKELYSTILNKLGVCGLSALASAALACLMRGLDIKLSTDMIVKAFIKSATDKEMEKVFSAFPSPLQQFIRDSVAEITSIPLPWEAGYRPGSYQGAGVKYSADYASSSGSIEARLEKLKEEGGAPTSKYTEEGELKYFRAKAKTTIEEQQNKFNSSDSVPSGDKDADGNEIMVAPPSRVSDTPGLGPKAFAGPFAHAGSIGTALDNIQDNAIVHLKTAIVKAIEEEIISGATIMGFIDKIPGSKLLKTVLSENKNNKDCPPPPMFSPPLDDVLKTLELDFCKGHYAITLPVMKKSPIRPFQGDLKTIIIEGAEAALENLVARAMTLILKKILTVTLNASCEVLKDTGAILKDIAGGANFREIVADNLCGDTLNSAELDRSLNNLNKALGSLGIAGSVKPTDQDMGRFMDGTSAILNQQELLELLDGAPTDQAVRYVRQIVNDIPNLAAALPTDDHIKNLFAGMGRIFDREKIRNKIRSTSFKPVSPSVCASPEHLEMFNNVRCSILTEKGMTPEQCEDQLEKLKDRTLLDFEALAGVLNQNYFGDIDILGDPSCPENGIYPANDPETLKQTREMFSSNDNAINSSFMTELLTQRGMLNMILADTNGTGFKRHNQFWVKFFGQPNSADFGPFGFYAHEDTGNGGSLLVPAVFIDVQGVYPKKVAPYLQNILAGTLNAGDYKNDENPNLSLNFENWDNSDGAPKYVKVDYNYQRNDDRIINMKIHSEGDKFGPPLEFDVTQSHAHRTFGTRDPALKNVINLGQPPDSNDPKQAVVFGQLGKSSWSKHTSDQSDKMEKFFRTNMFEFLTSKIIEKFAFKISENARTFKFGYDSNAEATIVELDHTQYGGTEKNPAFYVEPPKYSGWLGIYDKIIPEVGGCDKKPILDFNSVSEQTSEYDEKLKDDPRLQIPAACAIDLERPFNRIMPKSALAGVDGAIRSTVRLYVIENFLKGLPAFSLFAPKFPQTYNDTLSGYIAAKIKAGLLDAGRNFRTRARRENYYYTFLEEVVQNFGKKVDIGDIIPNAAQLSAMESINNLQEKWSNPPKKPRIDYPKRLRNKWISYIRSVEKDCLVLLNYYISEQLVDVGKSFIAGLEPSIPNLESWIFGSSDWMVAGAISENGPMDVATDPASLEDPTTAIIMNLELGSSPLSDEPYASGYFPFILEKYIKATPSGDSTIEGPPQPQINGLQWWKDELDKSTEQSNAALDSRSLTPGPRRKESYYGLRLSMVMPEAMAVPIEIFDFDNSISPEQVKQTKSLKFGPDTDTGTRRYVVPIASVEIPIGGNLDLTSDLVDQYDINCMISELINTPEYKTLFNYCLPLQSLLSLVTIYTIETFLLSIGSEWGGGAKGSQFKRWDKEGDFKKTKRNLRKLFEAFYHARDANYQDEERETDEERTREKIKVNKVVPTDKDIAWWKKRLQVPKPTTECE